MTSALTKASWPIKIGNQEFAASPLCDRDYDELDNYIQAKVIDVARKAASTLGPSDKSEILQAAVKAAASSGWGTTEGGKIIRTVEGMLRLGWQMIRAKHRDVSFEQFYKLSRVDDNTLTSSLEEIDIAFTKLNLSTEDASEASSEPKS